jgi:hypothetical protein
MPKLLRFMTAHALACFVFLAMSVIPNDSLSIDGHHVSYVEWWSSGFGLFASLVGISGVAAGWSLLSKRKIARATYLGFLALGMVLPYPFMGVPVYALIGVGVVAIAATYLYRSQKVRRYFAPTSTTGNDGLHRFSAKS